MEIHSRGNFVSRKVAMKVIQLSMSSISKCQYGTPQARIYRFRTITDTAGHKTTLEEKETEQ